MVVLHIKIYSLEGKGEINMKRSFTKFATAIGCLLLLIQPLACFAADKPVPAPPPFPEEKTHEETSIPEADPQRPPFLTLWHSSIPDNSTPESYGLPGKDWNAYDLAEVMGDSFEITLFGNITNEVTIEEMDDSLFRAELNEKLAILDHEIDLTCKLNELILVPADGGSFPRTKNNGQLFTGTMQILPYNGVIHHIVISEEYTVRPGDTISQIILDCGWLPESSHLYGPDGYLKQYAKQQGIDLDRVLMPGDVIRWRSEDIQVVDNLNPDIKISVIPGQIFSGGNPASF